MLVVLEKQRGVIFNLFGGSRAIAAFFWFCLLFLLFKDKHKEHKQQNALVWGYVRSFCGYLRSSCTSLSGRGFF